MDTLEISQILDCVDQFAQKNNEQPKHVNILRLLAEEGKNMINELLKHPTGEFDISKEQNVYSLHFKVNAIVYKKDKKEFLELAKDKKNIYSKGILGKIASAIDNFFTAYDETSSMLTAAAMNSASMIPHFSMNSYMYTLSDTQKKEEWDGLEKSILVNFADDILVGAKSNQVEIIVKKSFA